MSQPRERRLAQSIYPHPKNNAKVSMLMVGHLSCEKVPERLTKGLARHPVPLMLLARLAVDHRWLKQI